MKNYAWIDPLLCLLVFCTGCGQNQPDLPKENARSETKDTVTSYGPTTMVRNIKHARNGDLLLAASWSGVFRYDGKSFTNLASKIGSRRYWDVLEDRKGHFWFASTYSGAYYSTGTSFQHFTTKEGLAHNSVMCIYEDRAGIIWLGTGGGISRYDGKSFRNFTTKEGPLNNDITRIIEDKTGKLWIGTRGEAFVYDGKTFTPLTHEGTAFHNVWGLLEDAKGTIWLGGDEGLWRNDGSAFTKVSQRGASAIIQDRRGNLWTTGAVKPGYWALSRYDAKSLYSKTPTVTEIMSGERKVFLGILEANDGSIWVGSMQGLYRYDGKTITDFKREEGQK